MNYKTLRFLIPALGAALLLSCEVEEPVPAGPVEDGEITPVTVSLQLSLGGEQNGTPGTRAIDDPADKDDTQIRNLCILQYNGTTDDAPLVGEVHYLRDDVAVDDENYLNLNAIKLAASWGAEHTLVILTNTFTQLPKVSTLGEMLSLWRTVGSEPDVFGHTGQGESFPNDTDYYQRMNALVVAVIDEGVTIKGTLRRSMARINVVIDNDGTDGLQIRRVQLRNVSMKDYYVTDYSYIDAEDNVQLLRDTPFQDEYVPAVPMRADYKPSSWPGVAIPEGESGMIAQPAETGANLDGTGVATYRWYVSSNMRGTSGNTLPSEKNMSTNASGATYLYILATYGDPSNEYIEYKFYLGENLVDDFNLKPNNSYTYRLTFRGKGNTVTDKRVNDYGTVNFKVDANCYIVNPPVEGTRKYTFNVVHRPNIFWGKSNAETDDRYGLFRGTDSYNHYPSNYIGTTETWNARILWCDVNYDMDAILSVPDTRNGGGGYMDACQRVVLNIPSDITRGNMVIGVWTGDDPNIILWSWHIWITDYQPDDIMGHKPDYGVYLYNVEGGEVHRYRGGNWEGSDALYKDGYAMDRNLGAWSQVFPSNTTQGAGFYYQFGRKDPFPGSYTFYAYSYDAGVGGWTSASTNSIPTTANSATNKDYRNVPWSVNNPRTFITSSNSYWTYKDIFNPIQFNKNIVWQDPLNTLRTDNEEILYNASKSFFDPCPPGWKVPVLGCYSHFTGDGNSSSSTSLTATFQFDVETFNGHNRGQGRTYYPLTFAESIPHPTESPTSFFPEMGGHYATGGLADVRNRGNYYYSTPKNAAGAYFLNYGQSYVSQDNAQGRGQALPIRCVREGYVSTGL